MINYDLLKLLGILTVAVIWWVAIWGICDHCIALLKKHTILTEMSIYLIILISVYAILTYNPDMLQHF